MPSNLNKVGLTLVLPLLTALSLNLSASEQEGYYYFPPCALKKWAELTPKEQKKAKELNFDRRAFADFLLSETKTKKWAEECLNTPKIIQKPNE